MPSQIDVPAGHDLWTQQEQNLYYKLPLFMNKLMVDTIPFFSRWTKLLKPVSWTANSGTEMQGVRKTKSPVRRQMALPTKLQVAPTRDIEEIRETQEKVSVYHKKFESNLMHWVPSFQDFLTDHVTAAVENLTEKVMIYTEQFYRTAIFHGAPAIWIAGKAPGTELTYLPYWTAPTIALSKDVNVLQASIAEVGKTLDVREIIRIASVMEEDLKIVPYSGKTLGDGTDGSFLKGLYCLISGSGVWNKFLDDDYVTENKEHDMKLVNAGFRGRIAGKVTSLAESHELRLKADGTFPQPETTEEGADNYNFGETVPGGVYASADAAFAVAYMCGGEGYKALRTGGAPKDFAKGEMSMKEFRALKINGEVRITKDVLVPVPNEDGTIVNDTNKYGEYLQLISYLLMGILPIQRRNIIPILYRRARVAP